MTPLDDAALEGLGNRGTLSHLAALGLVFDQAPIALSLLDLDGEPLAGNPAYARLFGYEPSDVSGLAAWAEATGGESTPELVQALASGDRDVVVADRTYVRRDGSTFVGRLTAAALRGPDGVPWAVLGAVSDVTEEHAATRSLQESRRRLQVLLANIADTVTLLDEAGNVITSTGEVKSLLGHPTDFWADLNVFDLAHPDDLPRALRFTETVLATPEVELTEEFRVRDATGEYQHVEVTAVNLVGDPLVAGVVVTSRNISARKAAEQVLREHRDQALELSQARAELVAKVSHELRNPLHALLGTTELLGARVEDPGLAELAVTAHRQAVGLRHLVDDLFDFSRIEAGRIELQPTPVVVRRLAEDLESLGRTLAAPGVLVVVDVDRALPTALALDGPRFGQVLSNLVGNAAKYTRSGSIRVRFEPSLRDGGGLRVVVADTGIGIDPEYRDRLFEPFQQGDPETTRVFGGTGLGLAIAQKLVELMGGSIGFDSTQGVGTTFWVDLPAGEAEVARPAVAAATRPAGPRGHVLVVEDSPVNRMLFAEQLVHLGHTAETVASGEEAIERVRQGGIDVVLMDWQLPGLDGLDTTRALRADGGTGLHVPVVGVTASASTSDRQACFDAGMDDFLPKPVTIDDLRITLERWLTVGSSATVAADPAGAAVLDRSALEGMVASFGSGEPVRKVVATFLDELTERRVAVVAARRAADGGLVVRHAHALGSTAAMVGAQRLAECCGRLQDDPLDDDSGDRFAHEASAADEALRAWLSTP